MTCWAMTNRYDSVDALMYAYCELMKIKEENKMLEKDKGCIEFSMRSMMATHKPYQEDTEIAITGMAPGKSLLLSNNPFDIPCEVVMVSKKDFEALQTENEQLKKKLQVPDPIPEYKELLEKLHSKEDVEKFEWTLNHVCGGQASVNGWMVTAKLWRRNYETLSKLVGFSSTEEIQDYLTNEAECDTLHGAISKLKDQVKYTCDEWYSANSSNNSWKAAAECNLPKELIEKIKGFRDEIGIYSRALKDWKEGTGCPSPSAAKTLIESQVSWCHAYDDVKAANEKLADDIKSWKNVTGYSTPEDYMHARINCAAPFDYTAAWQNFTGCDCAQEAGVKINNLCDEICKLKVDYDRLLKLTGYKSEDAIRVLLNLHEQFVYESMRELINSLKRKLKFTESNWQAATGCNAPEKAQCKITDLYNRIDKMKEAASIVSNWTDKIVEV